MKKHVKTARKSRTRNPHRWSAKVTERSDAMDLTSGVFQKRDPREIAASILRSAKRSKRRKASAFRSAMSMLTFYINRAGHNLGVRRRKTLEKAKDELRQLREEGKA